MQTSQLVSGEMIESSIDRAQQRDAASIRKSIEALVPRARTKHGGSLARGRRKHRRPLSPRKSLHVVLKSERARGQRALIRHINFIQSRIRSAARRFGVRVHGRAIHFNHIHLHVRGKTRVGTQNFFRVVAGHIAQEILDQHPLTAKEVRETPVGGRKFWADLVFTRVVAWGRDFRNVKNYLVKNIRQVEESLGVAYIEVLSQGAESG